jgi:cytochrome c oxidase cbb3-type subunit 3
MNHEKNKSNSTKNTDKNTTGHNWDGIEEYNIPSPRWWLIIWIITIIWSIGYWFFYPTWPTKSGNSKGSLNWTQQSQLLESQAEIDSARSVYLKKFSSASFDEIKKDSRQMEFAINGGKIAFKENCAACHGTGAQGGGGFPNLNDDDWIWGGKVEDIYQTILYGIRSSHKKTRENQMPSFGLDKILTKQEISSTVEYVMSLSGKAPYNQNGGELFKANCASCHGSSGIGNKALGAPNLADAIWLYGNSKDDVAHTVFYARNGVMPYWNGRLSNDTIKQLAIYVYSLGGGED